MKRFFLFSKSTLVGGVWFLVPLVVLMVVLGKAHQIANKIVAPLAHLIPVDSIVGFGVARILAVVAILLFCFLAGLFAQTRIAQKFVDWIEAALLSNLPGYDFMKSMGATLVGLEQRQTAQVVLARIEEAWQIGFLTETLDNGLHAVFVPGAPSPWSGAVYFMTEDRFKRLDISHASALKCVRRLGLGSKELLAGRMP